MSRWWMPGEHIAGGEQPTWSGYENRLHHALRANDQLWASVPFPEPTHTVLRVPFPVTGRQIAVAVDEEHVHTPGQPHAGLWVFDVGDLADIKPLSMFHLSERDSPFSDRGRFGAHQFQEHMTDTLLYTAWFGGGLRIVDIADPTLPREVGHFTPAPAAGVASPRSNDVDVDKRGLIYLLDRDQGLGILEYTGTR